jgi:hypothetical protein
MDIKIPLFDRRVGLPGAVDPENAEIRSNGLTILVPARRVGPLPSLQRRSTEEKNVKGKNRFTSPSHPLG